ncbi:penicillin-binding transpeptidase domain-containing protein [Actinospica sp.]|uniref:penicillin-binding transpeptidase domain-containing protein n=1 Tax=Actinospica sp. TaxID=1872142 RepID=UPI002BF796A5|nr:penicillin-binding transpeptidase domain-containing protein [Actinospica sp.]HWG27264.1 penicillin-binding transpeptidase domain-containing protein [Actinospica sp.]
MNRPIKKVAIFCFALFAALFLSGNWIQVVKASSYSAHPDNYRNTIYNYQVDRGSIIVGSTNVASSTPTKSTTLKYQRVYSSGPEYAPVTGYFSSNYGNSNLEQYENTLLNGKDTRLATQNFIRKAEGKDQAGGSVVTTINAKAQDAAYQALTSELSSVGEGAVAAINPKTGAILALVSAPSYDPNKLASSSSKTQNDYATQLANNSLQPKLDRALNQTYPPGSTFKIVTSAAALTDGLNGQTVTPSTSIPNAPLSTLTLPQSTSTISNSGGETCNSAVLMDAFAQSCNTVFGYVGMQLGDSNVQSMAQGFGFNKTGPTVPMTTSTSVFPSNLSQAQLAQSSIGQFDVTMTPLEGAMMASAVANGGTIEAPYLIAKELDTSGNVIASASPTTFSTPMSGSVASELSTMMQDVVTSGTATSLQNIGVSVAAKTGTAERGTGQNPVAWMVAYAPANNPQVAVAVMVADNNVQPSDAFGNSLAGPIAASVIKAVIG